MSPVLTLAPIEGGSFKSIPEQLGFSASEGAYYIKRNAMDGLDAAELERVRSALERGAYRLAHVECAGQA